MRALLMAGIAVVIGAGSAHASYIGDTIAATLSFGPNGANGGQYWGTPSIVAPGTFNYSDGSNADSAAFQDGTTLTITDVVKAGANGFGMTFQDLTNAFTSVLLVSSNFAPGLTSSFANGVIGVNWTGTATTGVTYTATFNVTNAIAAAVPEPASFALLGMGLAGLASVRRRRAN